MKLAGPASMDCGFLRMLLCLAKDGQPATSTLSNYVEARLAMAGLQHSQGMTDAMLAIGAGLAVPFSSYIRAVNFIAPDESHFELVRDCVVEMIEAEHASTGSQQEAYHRLMATGLATRSS